VKKFFIFLLLCIGGVGAFLYTSKQNAPTSGAALDFEATTPVSLSTVPNRIIIPKLEVAAEIEHVGLDEEKRMDVPKDDMNVAWYKYGPKPGDPGSAVFAGHFDTKTGSPAVFNRLSELSTGDTIIVEGEGNNEKTFVVTEVKKFKDETFPVDLVFYQKGGKYLNLITCDGVFDAVQKNYSDRLVVFTKLKES
jgi:sortase A